MSVFFYANDNYNSNLSAGFTAGETTMSVINVPANVPTLLCFGYGTDKECVYSITDKTTNSLTGVARVSGYAGNLDAQMTVACLNNEGFINQLKSVVSSPETLADNIYGADGGGTDAYEISLDSPPSAYVTGMFILFRANTENTGACTLNVNGLGAKAIKKNYNADLNDNDITAGQVVGVVYDGTNFQMVGGNTAKASSAEINTGTEPNKFITPEQLAESNLPVPTASGTTGYYLKKSDGGSEWAGLIVNRAFTWYLDGTSVVADEVGAKYIAPQNLTVVKIIHKTVSGTATIRLQNGTTDIDADISVTSSAAAETSITTPSITANDVITLDITAASSCVGLTVTMECTQP